MNYKGIVQKGGAYGHTLGFPTANIPFDAGVSGIYAAKVQIGDKKYTAAVYANTERKVLEAHLLDFNGDLYGKEISIELLEKIREDQKFQSADEAKKTIADDVEAVRDYFKTVH